MNLAHPHFAEPAWLWLALLGPAVLIFLHRYSARMRKQQLARIAVADLLAHLTASHSPARRVVKRCLLVLAVAGIGLALARPQWGETQETSRALGEDIMFVLDCSRSMLSTDVDPSRLGRARFAILDFVERHGRGRVGLVAFSGDAFLQCPLTFDYEAFREALGYTDDRTIPVPGTDIGRALDEASKAMEQNDRRKIMVLVTDGEDLEKTGVTMAKALAKKGVVVFTVGVGTAAGSEIHFIDERGARMVVQDSQGNAVVSHLDSGTLTEIAQATRGSYAPLGPLGEGLTRVRHEIEDSADYNAPANIRKLGVDRFHWFVGVVIVLLVGESLIGTRRKLRHSQT